MKPMPRAEIIIIIMAAAMMLAAGVWTGWRQACRDRENALTPAIDLPTWKRP